MRLSHQLLEPVVLQLQAFEPLDVSDLQQAKVLAPGIDRGLTHLVLLGSLWDGCSICLEQDRHQLLLRESTLTHGFLVDWRHLLLVSVLRRNRAGHLTTSEHSVRKELFAGWRCFQSNECCEQCRAEQEFYILLCAIGIGQRA